MKTRYFITLYYLCLSYVTYSEHFTYQKLDFSQASFIGFAKIFSLFPVDYKLLEAMPFTVMGSCLLTALVPHRFIFRLVSSSLFLLFISLLYSFGKINHNNHTWFITAPLILFMAPTQTLSSLTNLRIIRLIQTCCLLPYLCSGLWKMRTLDFGQGLPYLKATILNHVAFCLAEGNGPSPSVLHLILEYQNICLLGFILVIFFQVTCFVPIVRGRHFIAYGLMALLFHGATFVTLGIGFMPQVIAILFFLVGIEIVYQWPLRVGSSA